MVGNGGGAGEVTLLEATIRSYNTVYAQTSALKSLNAYLGDKVGEVKEDVLARDLEEMVDRLGEALEGYKKQ